MIDAAAPLVTSPAATPSATGDPEVYDVIVIGAGVAGSVAAWLAARRGLSVLLIEKRRMPREKVCGGCLNAAATAMLERVGLGGVLLEAGASPVDRLRLRTRERSVTLELPRGAAVSRGALDAALLRHAHDAGVTVRTGVRATVGEVDGGTRSVRLEPTADDAVVETPTARARVVVAATGLSLGRDDVSVAEPMLRWREEPGSWVGMGVVVSEATGRADWPEHDPVTPGEIVMTLGRGGYVGVVRVESGRWNVAAAVAPGSRSRNATDETTATDGARGPGAAAAALLAEAGVVSSGAMARWPWRGTPRLTRRRDVPAVERLLLVGDAAGYVEPFTGEGMAWAIRSAIEVDALVAEGVRRWRPALERRWAHRLKVGVVRRQRWCRVVRAAVHRPWLAAIGMAALQNRPWLAVPAIRAMERG